LAAILTPSVIPLSEGGPIRNQANSLLAAVAASTPADKNVRARSLASVATANQFIDDGSCQ
jgi:hypothetical protein